MNAQVNEATIVIWMAGYNSICNLKFQSDYLNHLFLIYSILLAQYKIKTFINIRITFRFCHLKLYGFYL